ncbi:MAG: M14 family metallopeptidase [Cytophagaceae bacterium]|nr:M14 family metallopeptidase [Cytophagaceae bacterium]
MKNNQYPFAFFLSLVAVSILAVATRAFAQQKPTTPKDPIGIRAMGTPPNPKVQISWNRYSDYKGLTDIMQRIVKAYPDLARIESMGKSTQGREMYVLTVTDLKSGKTDKQKPAFWTDGNIHSNELQGAEMALYAAWYLTENHATSKFVQDILRDKAFYFAPTINPDARDDFIHNLNTANSPRSGLLPLDDDGDGKTDEDGFDDIDGDGEVTMMRRKSANGRMKVNPDDPRMLLPARPDEPGEYEMLGLEGLDNDGDGLVNEDRPGVYDPNRDWGWGWQPDYIQGGAYKYPFSFAENRNVMQFVMSHPNIAGAQSYHNTAGMFLRGPGAAEDDQYYEPADVRVYDFIGQTGEKIVPSYQYGAIHKILYTVYGGEIDWFALSRGIFTFSNELWNSYQYFNKKDSDNTAARSGTNPEPYDFDRLLLHGDAFVDWKPFKHPQYGDIEVGGFKKNYLRNNPGFMLETDGHRNASFTIFHAYHTPKIEVHDVVKRDMGGGFSEVTATVSNARVIPTHSAFDVKNKVNAPDYVTLKDANVAAGLVMTNPDGAGFGFGGQPAFESYREQKLTPQSIEVANIPGMGYVKVRWLVKGNPSTWNIEVNSQKGGLTTASGKF